MSKNSLVNNFIILWILLQVIIIEVNCQMAPIKPSVSFDHTATFIDNKLYILGGLNIKENYVGKEFFYLDVSVPFNTQNLLWKDLTNINMLPPHSSATSVANNDTIFLYGGFRPDKTMALVYTFNTRTSSWSIPKIAGVVAIAQVVLKGILAPNEKLYLFGGYSSRKAYANDMTILDTVNLNWEKGSLVNAPTPRSSLYYPTIRLFIWVYIYDIINDSWNTEKTTGNIPSNRGSFSAVLGLDGQKVIIYGGYFNDPGYLDNSLYVLDLTNFNWYIPKTSGNIPEPRARHQANVIGKYMVISFGHGYDKSVESDILLLDISNNEEYIWTTIFDPPKPNKQKTNHGKDNFGQEEIEIPIEKVNNNEQEIIQVPLNEKTINHEPTIIPVPVINENIDYHGREIMEISKNENTINNEQIIIPVPVINENNDYHGQEIMVISKNENTINHEPTIIPVPVINENNDYHEREIMETPNNENTINHEPTIIPASVINEDDYHEQEIMETPNNKNTINHEPTIIPASVINEDYHEQEIITPNNENTINHEPTIIPASVINKNNDHHGREIMETSKNENTTNHEPILIPTLVINEDNGYHEKEISLTYENGNTTNHEPVLIPTNGQTLEYESTTNHEPRIPTSALVTSNHNQQEVISTSNHDRLLLQLFKDEMLQAVKQEISQNLKNEIIQA
ncbi:19550_t:CDS:2, partial [Rhizophagus irregularis]